MDGPEVVGTDPADPFARAVLASRRLATNHFTGWGYWIWFIPLKDGETSVGLVWDKRLVTPEGSTPLEKLLAEHYAIAMKIPETEGSEGEDR